MRRPILWVPLAVFLIFLAVFAWSLRWPRDQVIESQMIGQPAAWTVPLAFAVMIVGSLATSRRVPKDVGATMLRLHAPESLRL